MICDFCSSPKPVKGYSARDIDVLGGFIKSYGHWAACEECRELIDAEKWAGLENRCVDIFAKMNEPMPKALVRVAVQDLHRKFREARETA